MKLYLLWYVSLAQYVHLLPMRNVPGGHPANMHFVAPLGAEWYAGQWRHVDTATESWSCLPDGHFSHFMPSAPLHLMPGAQHELGVKTWPSKHSIGRVLLSPQSATQEPPLERVALRAQP